MAAEGAVKQQGGGERYQRQQGGDERQQGGDEEQQGGDERKQGGDEGQQGVSGSRGSSNKFWRTVCIIFSRISEFTKMDEHTHTQVLWKMMWI